MKMFRRKSKPEPSGDTCEHCKALLLPGANSRTTSTYYVAPDGCKVHKECWSAYQDGVAPKCLQCQGPIAQIPGRYSGKFHKPASGGQVHDECWLQYEITRNEQLNQGFTQTHRPKDLGDNQGLFDMTCLQCNIVIRTTPGKHTGEYMILDSGKVHTECFFAYQSEHTPACLQCGKPCFKHGNFSGVYCIYDDGKVHSECNEAYQDATAPKCVQCSKSVRGKYYSTENKQRVHIDCWDVFTAATAQG